MRRPSRAPGARGDDRIARPASEADAKGRERRPTSAAAARPILNAWPLHHARRPTERVAHPCDDRVRCCSCTTSPRSSGSGRSAGSGSGSIARPTQSDTPEVLHDGDAPVSVGRSPRRSCQELHARRRGRAHDAHAGLQRAASDGLGRLRTAGRERGDRSRDRSGRVDDREHPQHAPSNPLDGNELRLVARDRDVRARVLPLESMALLASLRARSGVQARSAGELVPARPNRARQRAGHRRALLALRIISSSGATSRNGS